MILDQRKNEAKSKSGKKGAASRWGLPVIAEGRLPIGGMECDCYVLKDTRRVLGTKHFLKTMKLSDGGYHTGDRRLARLAKGLRISQFANTELIEKLENPIKVVVKDPKTEKTTRELAYPCECLTELCSTVLEARQAGILQKQQLPMAKQAEIIMRGLAHIGLISLIDEATGYEDKRGKGSLAKFLEEFIAKEKAAWVKTFPDAYYEELFRLHGITNENICEKPLRFGKITNDIVYRRLAPGILTELEKVNPKDEEGRRNGRHHSWLTENARNTLNRHIYTITGMMTASKSWNEFVALLNKKFPKFKQNKEGEVSHG